MWIKRLFSLAPDTPPAPKQRLSDEMIHKLVIKAVWRVVYLRRNAPPQPPTQWDEINIANDIMKEFMTDAGKLVKPSMFKAMKLCRKYASLVLFKERFI